MRVSQILDVEMHHALVVLHAQLHRCDVLHTLRHCVKVAIGLTDGPTKGPGMCYYERCHILSNGTQLSWTGHRINRNTSPSRLTSRTYEVRSDSKHACLRSSNCSGSLMYCWRPQCAKGFRRCSKTTCREDRNEARIVCNVNKHTNRQNTNTILRLPLCKCFKHA